MKKLLLVLFSLILIFASVPMRLQSISLNMDQVKAFMEEVANQKVVDVVKQNTVSIFSVGGGMGWCSGVVIDETEDETYILTCKHCINPAEEIYVENNKAETFLTFMDEDLAFVIVKGTIPNKKAVVLADTKPTRGTKLIHVGYPKFEEYISFGEVLRTTNDWQFSSFVVKGGCSGGGVYNQQKELVGILWGGLGGGMFSDTSTISIYEPIDDIKVFLQKAKTTLKIK